MRDRIAGFVKTAASAAIALAAFVAAAEAQEKLRWAHVQPLDTPLHTSSVWAAEEIRRQTGGRYEISVFGASSLGTEATLDASLLIGGIDILIAGPSFAARSYPRLGISYYPFIFADADHLLRYSRSDLFREMTQEFEAKTGVRIAAYQYYGSRHTTTSGRTFTSCSQMAGLKIRVPPAPAYTAMPRACGANPTPVAFAEVYLALQNRTVDAQENPLPTIQSMKFFEVQKAIMLTGHIVDGLITQLSPQLWRRLPAADRTIFETVMQQAAQRATDELKAQEAQLVDFFRGRGLEVVEVDKESFREALLKNVPVESMGFTRADYDRIQKLR